MVSRFRHVSLVLPGDWRYRHNTGANEGSIIAAIITIHMRTKEAVAPAHACPGIRIHAIDIVQPPGISIAPAADIVLHQAVVTATQTTNTIPKSKTKVCRDAFSETTRPRLVIEMQASKLPARDAG
jgi:hypothetical protein